MTESRNRKIWRWLSSALCVAMLLIISGVSMGSSAQMRRSERSVIRGGMVQRDVAKADSLQRDTLATSAQDDKSASLLGTAQIDTTKLERTDRQRFFTDSMSLSKVAWASAVLPGYGQIYNKQYWKLPVIYSALAGSILLYSKENKKYKPLKKEYDALTLEDLSRNDYVDNLQGRMIRSNTRRQIYLGAAIASYIYSIGDAAINYSTNDVSDVKRATTLATIFPGAGQIYNKSYWKVPFVVGGFASMIYVIDWNNRGYKRFTKAYKLVSAYEKNEDPDKVATDEFGGRYSAKYLLSLRNSYRRNRDLSIIMTAGLYILQIIDAHVDAHFKDYDISDDLAMSIEPTVGYTYSPTINSDTATFGFNLAFKF